MMALRWVDLTVIVVYLGAMVGIGLWFARRQTSTEEYFVAKRSIPHWAMGVSIYAALISSITFIAYPGSAYAGNWNELVPGFMVVGVLIVVGLVIIPFFRQAVGMSAYEYFGKRFGYKVRAYSALAFTAGHFSKMGFVFYTLALTITAMTGWDIKLVMVVTGVVTVFYTVVGGLEAVIWTDVIQGFIKCIGIFVCLGFLFYLIPGGPSAAFKLAWDNHKFSLGSFDFDLTKNGSVWVMTLYGFFWYLQKYTADQTLVQRYLVARTDREALKGVALGALLCVPAWMLFMLIGTLMWAYYQLTGEALPPQIDKADKIFPHFLATKIPVGLAGMFMASLLAAAMSMLASDLNCLSVVGVEDYYRKLRPNSTDRQRLVMGKMIVAGCGVVAVAIGIIIALYSNRVLSFYYMVTSIIAAGLAGLFLLAFLSRRANRQGVYIGITACLLFTAWGMMTSGDPKFTDNSFDDFPKLTASLQTGADPASVYLRAHLSVGTQEALAKKSRSVEETKALQGMMVKDLNGLLAKDALVQEPVFAALKLSKPARDLAMSRTRTKDETRRLNRLVLEQAFPAEIDTYLTMDLGRFNFRLHPVMIGVLAHLVLLGVGFGASFFFPPPPPEDRAMTLWGWRERVKRERQQAANGLKEPNGQKELGLAAAGKTSGGGQ
jgi:SSS family solute:Na+ symporter